MAEDGNAQFDQRALRDAFGSFPSGVAAVCGLVDGVPVGMAASSFTSVSLEPALVSVCIATTSSTWPLLAGLPRIGISVLAHTHGAVARSLASKNGDRFADVSWEATPDGAVYVHDSSLWLDTSIYASFEAGDHDIVVFQIHALETSPDLEPLVFHQSKFRQLAV